MSIRRRAYVECDTCTEGFYDDPGHTSAEARLFAQHHGGFHRSNGKDICPDCWKQGKR